MMVAHDRQFDSAGSVQLSQVERTALAYLTKAANEGRQVTQNDICGAIGSNNLNGGTATGVLKRLEQKGQIRRRYFQRGVQVCIIGTGECTAEPQTKAPHWRDIAQRSEKLTPVIAIHQLTEEAPNIATYIGVMMREENLSYTAASIALLSRGIAHRDAERMK